MKKAVNFIKQKSALLLVITFAAIVGGATTAVVMAAIPNSQTGQISACYRNQGGPLNPQGSLRVIDSQAGQSCNALESSLNWKQHGVLAYGLVDFSTNTVSNSDMPSFNITALYPTVTGSQGTCIELNGFPKAVNFAQYGQGGASNSPSVILRGTNPGGDTAILDERCGTATADALVVPITFSSYYLTFFE